MLLGLYLLLFPFTLQRQFSHWVVFLLFSSELARETRGSHFHGFVTPECSPRGVTFRYIDGRLFPSLLVLNPPFPRDAATRAKPT